MSVGPHLIFDKFALECLSLDETNWLDNFFYTVISDKTQADLVLVVTDKGGMKSLNPSFYLNVIDPKTGNELWTCRTTMQGKLWRSWDSVAETLLGDIRKRMRGNT
jgi:hypothetical protein